MFRQALLSFFFKCLRGFLGLQDEQFGQRSAGFEVAVENVSRDHKKQCEADQENGSRPRHDSQVNGFHETRTSAGTNTYPTPRTLRIKAALLLPSTFFLRLLI